MMKLIRRIHLLSKRREIQDQIDKYPELTSFNASEFTFEAINEILDNKFKLNNLK